MGIERINPDTVYAPNNDAYSQVVTATGTTHVHVAGMVGLTRERDLVSEDMREQTAQALAMISNALEAAGADASDVVRVRVLTTDVEEYLERCSEVTVEWFGEHKPASTLEEVAGLAQEALKVEIEVTAVVDE